MEQKPFRETIEEQLTVKGITLERLSNLTGIAERHLESLFHGKSNTLPALPYVRGYIHKIARVLDMNGEDIWKSYVAEGSIASSGPLDRLPINRFAIRTINRMWLWGGAIVILVVGYLVWNASHLVGEPRLEITNPTSSETEVKTPTITLLGKIDPRDKLMISGEVVTTDPTGQFKKEYTLEPGSNLIEFVVNRVLGREHRETRLIYFSTTNASTTTP